MFFTKPHEDEKAGREALTKYELEVKRLAAELEQVVRCDFFYSPL
jgi:hypothetical protein